MRCCASNHTRVLWRPSLRFLLILGGASIGVGGIFREGAVSVSARLTPGDLAWREAYPASRDARCLTSHSSARSRRRSAGVLDAAWRSFDAVFRAVMTRKADWIRMAAMVSCCWRATSAFCMARRLASAARLTTSEVVEFGGIPQAAETGPTMRRSRDAARFGSKDGRGVGLELIAAW